MVDNRAIGIVRRKGKDLEIEKKQYNVTRTRTMVIDGKVTKLEQI